MKFIDAKMRYRPEIMCTLRAIGIALYTYYVYVYVTRVRTPRPATAAAACSDVQQRRRMKDCAGIPVNGWKATAGNSIAADRKITLGCQRHGPLSRLSIRRYTNYFINIFIRTPLNWRALPAQPPPPTISCHFAHPFTVIPKVDGGGGDDDERSNKSKSFNTTRNFILAHATMARFICVCIYIQGVYLDDPRENGTTNWISAVRNSKFSIDRYWRNASRYFAIAS